VRATGRAEALGYTLVLPTSTTSWCATSWRLGHASEPLRGICHSDLVRTGTAGVDSRPALL